MSENSSSQEIKAVVILTDDAERVDLSKNVQKSKPTSNDQSKEKRKEK